MGFPDPLQIRRPTVAELGFPDDLLMNNDENSLALDGCPCIGKSELNGVRMSTLYAAMDEDLVPLVRPTKSGFEASTADGRLLGPFNPLLYSPMVEPGFSGIPERRTQTSLP